MRPFRPSRNSATDRTVFPWPCQRKEPPPAALQGVSVGALCRLRSSPEGEKSLTSECDVWQGWKQAGETLQPVTKIMGDLRSQGGHHMNATHAIAAVAATVGGWMTGRTLARRRIAAAVVAEAEAITAQAAARRNHPAWRWDNEADYR